MNLNTLKTGGSLKMRQPFLEKKTFYSGEIDLMRFLLSLLVFLSLLIPDLSSATRYQRGNQVCGNFERLVERYNQYIKHNLPVPVGIRATYAECLVIRDGREGEGLRSLFELAQIDQNHDRIPTTFFLATYYSTGGTFNGVFDSRYFKDSLERYQRVLVLIEALGDNYALNFMYFSHAEREMHIHLNSLFNVALAQYMIFLSGASGKFNEDGHYVPKYPEYDPWHTRSHLDKTIRLAEKCANTARKRFHNGVKYFQITTACRAIEETAVDLWDLEEQRVQFVHSCKNSNPPTSPCTQEEYEERVTNQMLEIVKTGGEERQNALVSTPAEIPSSDR